MSSSSSSNQSPTNSVPSRTTVGVELEILVAAAKQDDVVDPHPTDGRELLQGTNGYDDEDAKFQVTVRNKIIDTLRSKGLVARKDVSEHIYLGVTPTFGWGSRLDDNPNDNNVEALGDWRGSWNWNTSNVRILEVDAATKSLLAQFVDFHISRGLSFRKTTEPMIWDIGRNKVPGLVTGIDEASIKPLICYWIERTKAEFELQALREMELENDDQEVDPNAVIIEGSDPKYRAWTCTRDASFGADNASTDDYEMTWYQPPEGSNPPAPPSEYKWFSGEVISPILDFASGNTFLALENACSAIRQLFRVHNPSSIIGTGLHIHFGQEAGWTLLHLKKFTTLWLLLEESLERLHRQDRSDPAHFFSKALRHNTNIARNLLVPSEGPPARSTVRSSDPDQWLFYLDHAEAHIPFELNQMDEGMATLIREIWQFETVDDLDYGMALERGYGHIRYRVSGASDRTEPPSVYGLQTLEIRIMAGTLDNEHIWHWMKICHQMIVFSRDATPKQFRDGIAGILTETASACDVLDIPVQSLNYFYDRWNENSGYFEYPDRDRVNWAIPFMLPGGGDVYSQ